jgi:serine/threonine-protein kinase HipA
MEALDYPSESIDLIWSEGALYVMELSTALRAWFPLLRPGGFFVFSIATWLTENPPPRAAAYFQKCYPQMSTVSGNLRKARVERYEVLGTYTLPAQAWWDECYKPLQERIELLRPQAAAWPELAAVIAETEEEISVFSQHSESYGYVFYMLRRPAESSR